MTPGAKPHIAIACGGTGGHLFPGLAVARQLLGRGCAVTLLVSPKEVDQQATEGAAGMDIVTLPAVGLTRGRTLAFVGGFVQSYRAAVKVFRSKRPAAVLAMGGFTSAPPILAARRGGARTFLHESNSIPGRANRWLSRVVSQCFVGFPSAAARLHGQRAVVTGTPVRPEFKPREPGGCRVALGLEPARPVVLVMGGSQGARGINEMVTRALPSLAQAVPAWQWFHLTGNDDVEVVKRTYTELKLTALVYPFFAGMDTALGAATVALSRAGASSLAELAAMRLPAVLVPYPSATDNHQFHNARAFVETGAARLLEQANATPEALTGLLRDLVENAPMRETMQQALARWHEPRAAEQIATRILESIGVSVLDERSSHKASQTVDPDRLARSVLESGQSNAAFIRRPTLSRCEASGSSPLAFQNRTVRTSKRSELLSAGQGELPL